MTNHEWKINTYYKKLDEERTARSFITSKQAHEIIDEYNVAVYISHDGTRRYDIPEELLSELMDELSNASHAYQYYQATACSEKMPIRTRYAFKSLQGAQELWDKLLDIWHSLPFADNRR